MRRLNGHPFIARGLVTIALLGAMALSFGVLDSSPAAPETKAVDTLAPAGNSGDTGNTGTPGDTTTTSTTTTTTTTTAPTTTPTTTTTTAPTTTTTTTAPSNTSTTTSTGSAGASASPSIFNDGTVTWTGNGAEDGTCDTQSDDSIGPVPNGETGWLFVLTQPGSAPFELTTNLGDATGTQQGNGSVHFVLFSTLGELLTSASAVTGTEGSVLTVSHCWNGTPLISTSSATVLDDAATNAPWTGDETTGAQAYDTSTVSGGSEGPTPTGTVLYTLFDNGTCTSPAQGDNRAHAIISTQSVMLNPDGTVPNSATTSPLTPGDYSFDASYSGDNNYAPSGVSDCEPFSVKDGPTTTATVLNDATTNQPWAGTETAGATAYDTSTVSGEAGGIVPTGTVTYSYFTNGMCNSPPVSTQDVTLNVNGSVPNSATTASLAAGSYSFDAVYNGDDNYTASAVSACEPFTVAVVTSPSTATSNTPTPTPIPTAGSTAAPAAVKGSAIAFTGADLAGMWAGAVALLGVGGFLVLASRRRRGQANQAE